MQNHKSWLIFTDLDGTLLNPDDYRYEAALPTLEGLRSRHIPIIAVTSKTRLEVEALQRELALQDPFIVENGSGVFIPTKDARFTLTSDLASEPWESYHLLRLGTTYAAARQALEAIATTLGEPLRGFGDLSAEEVQQLTGLAREAVQLAQQREFTEPFVTPRQSAPEQLHAAAQAQGFRVVVGDRFSHLIGVGASKGKAAQRLIQAYQVNLPDQNLTTIGLGNSPNDLSLLEVVDIPIIVPGALGPHPGLSGRGWQVAPAPGAQGWAAAVQAITAPLNMG